MQIIVERIDVSAAISNRQQPQLMMKRELPGNDGARRIQPAHAQLTGQDEWHIMQQKLPGDEAGRWSVDKTSPLVRIPMFDYLLPSPELEVLVHFGAQTAALAAHVVPKGRVIDKFFLAIGNVFQRPDQKPGFQVWAGFAVRLLPQRRMTA